MANEMVSQKVILQRIRNRIIEYLEITSSVHEQRKVEPKKGIRCRSKFGTLQKKI